MQGLLGELFNSNLSPDQKAIRDQGLYAGLLNAGSALTAASSGSNNPGALFSQAAQGFVGGNAVGRGQEQQKQQMAGLLGSISDPALRMAAQANPAAYSKHLIEAKLRAQKPETGQWVYNNQTGQNVFLTPAQIQSEPPGTLSPKAPEQPKTAAHKKVWNKETNSLGFATDKQIASSGGMLVPAPTGMKIVSDGKGGFTLVTGDMANQGGGVKLGAAGQNTADKNYMQAIEGLNLIDSYMSDYDPSFSTIGGQGINYLTAAKEYAGLPVSDERRQRLDKYTTWKRGVYDGLTTQLNALSGAAVSPEEFERIKTTMPTLDDSPTEFTTKVRAVREKLQLAAMRAYMFKTKGINPNQLNMSSWSLDKIKSAFNKRGDELAAELKKSNPKMAEPDIRARVAPLLRREFGV